MFHEYQRKVLRREIITQKGALHNTYHEMLGTDIVSVLPSNARAAFSIVFHRAQTILRTKFGMELYELRGKSKGAAVMEQTLGQTQTQAQTLARSRRGRRLDAIDEDEEDADEDDDAGAATQTNKKRELIRYNTTSSCDGSG